MLYLVVVDFSGTNDEEQQKASLREAKRLLIECGERKNAEAARLREDAAKNSFSGHNHRILKVRQRPVAHLCGIGKGGIHVGSSDGE